MSDPIAAVPRAAPTPISKRMTDKSFGVASFKYNRYSADLDETQTIEDALDENFWAHVADKIMGQDKANPRGIGDIIEIRKRDTAFYAEVIIVGIGKGFVKVHPLRAYAPADVAEADNSPLTTRWNPGRRCHEVIRKADKTFMHGGFQTKADAVAWIADHVKAMAA